MRPSKKFKQRKQPRRSLRDRGSTIVHGRLTESKVSQLGLHLEYLFEYGVDFKNRCITLTGDIEAPWFDVIDAALSEMESTSKRAITLRIKSEGGELPEALAIVGRLRNSKCQIVTEGYGVILSAATLILACGGRRKISKYASFMHHESSYELPDNRHTNQKAAVKQAEKEEKLWALWMADFTKKDKKFWYETGQNIDVYFTPDQLLKQGVVDEIF